MAAYSLSEKAVSDLDGIYEHTILNFGLEQARAYLLGLHERFQILADNPGIGRSAAQLAETNPNLYVGPIPDSPVLKISYKRWRNGMAYGRWA